MNKILLSFKIVKSNCYLDVVFDKRLSLLDNFNELEIQHEYDINAEKLKIYDPYKKSMLDITKPLDLFNFGSYRFLLVF